VNVKVKEGCRLQAMGYRVVRVENGRWKGFWGREPVPEEPCKPIWKPHKLIKFMDGYIPCPPEK